MVGRRSFPVGKVAFQGRPVKLREGKSPVIFLESGFEGSRLNYTNVTIIDPIDMTFFFHNG